MEKRKITVIVLPRKTREEQSPFLYKREQGMKSKTFEQLFPGFDEKPLPCKNIASMRNKLYTEK